MQLIKSTSIISSFTLISRLLGLVRDIFIARFLGAGLVSDAFFTAFKLPNLFRRMFAEGAFSAAFIPLYARRLEEQGADKADQFARETMAVLLTLVTLIVILFELTMPWTLSLIGYGLDRAYDPQTGVRPYYLAVLYAHITMPYLLCMTLSALFSGLLNSRGFFSLAAGIPIILNLMMIATLAIGGVMALPQRQLGLYLSLAVILSGFVQMGLAFWGCQRAGIRLAFRRPRLSPNMRRLFFLGLPGLFSAGITQINLLVSHSIATLQKGAASWLTYADRLYQLPLALIGIALGLALLPNLSRRLRAGDICGAQNTFHNALEIATFLTLPATCALLILADFFITGLFQRGAFTAETSLQTAKALRYFALGLPAFVLLKIISPAFFAHEDTKTPMQFAILSACINISLGISLFFSWGFQGLALATSLAAWVNVAGLVLVLRHRNQFPMRAALWIKFIRILLASLLMGVGLIFLKPYLSRLLSTNIIGDLLSLLLVCIIGFSFYAIAALLCGAFTREHVRHIFKP